MKKIMLIASLIGGLTLLAGCQKEFGRGGEIRFVASSVAGPGTRAEYSGEGTTNSDGLLTWEPQRGATAYAIFKNDVFVAIVGPNDTSFNLDADAADVITIRSANEMGGFGPAADLVLTLDENEENEIPESGTFVNTLNVKRTFAGNTWNTICLPVDIEESWTADEANPFYGASIMELANASYDEASMTQNFNFLPVSKAVAGKPYVIKFNNDVENPVLKYVTIKAEAPETIEAGNCTMTGLFNPYEFTESDKLATDSAS